MVVCYYVVVFPVLVEIKFQILLFVHGHEQSCEALHSLCSLKLCSLRAPRGAQRLPMLPASNEALQSSSGLEQTLQPHRAPPNLVLSARGLCLIKMGKLDAALSDFSKACELEPTAAVYHYQKASLLHHRLARHGVVHNRNRPACSFRKSCTPSV